jgi:hypothetical protein
MHVEIGLEAVATGIGMRSQQIFCGVAATLSCGGALMICASVSWADAGASGQSPPLPPIRPPSSSQSQPGGTTPALPSSVATPSVPQPVDAAACLADLRANHVEAEIVPAPPAPVADCGIAEPVRLSSIGLANGLRIDLPGHPILDCPFAITFTEFAQDLMVPLAVAILGSGIVALDTGGYSCRSPIRLPSGNPNPHAKGIAIDLSLITLADRRRIAIGHEANSTEALFARTVRKAAWAGSRPCWGRARTRPTPSTSISTSCVTGQPTTIAYASSVPNPAFAAAEPSARPVRVHFSLREKQRHSVFPAQLDQGRGGAPGRFRFATEHLV